MSRNTLKGLSIHLFSVLILHRHYYFNRGLALIGFRTTGPRYVFILVFHMFWNCKDFIRLFRCGYMLSVVKTPNLSLVLKVVAASCCSCWSVNSWMPNTQQKSNNKQTNRQIKSSSSVEVANMNYSICSLPYCKARSETRLDLRARLRLNLQTRAKFKTSKKISNTFQIMTKKSKHFRLVYIIEQSRSLDFI